MQSVRRVGPTGNVYWELGGKYHREDGPAVEDSHGNKWWYLNDDLHREDGPAVVYINGTKLWWLHGKYLSEEEHAYYSVRMGEFLLEFGADL